MGLVGAVRRRDADHAEWENNLDAFGFSCVEEKFKCCFGFSIKNRAH